MYAGQERGEGERYALRGEENVNERRRISCYTERSRGNDDAIQIAQPFQKWHDEARPSALWASGIF